MPDSLDLFPVFFYFRYFYVVSTVALATSPRSLTLPHYDGRMRPMADTQIRRVMTRVLPTVLAIFLLPGLLLFVTSTGLAATMEEVRWCRVDIPAESESGGWILAGGADTRHLARAADGTLYCYATPTGTAHRLFKSGDGGIRWSQTGGVQDTIVDIVTVPGNAGTLYYATSSMIYRSTDAGVSFVPLPANPGGSGANNLEITSLDITGPGTAALVAVGTRDTDASEYGGVFILDENNLPAGWVDTGIGSYDVCCVAFSPQFTDDGQLLAVTGNEADSFVLTRITGEDWGATISGAKVPGVVPSSAAIAFPDDYQALTEGGSLFIGLNTGSDGGDVYRISLAAGSLTAADLNIGSASGLAGVDVTSLDITGTTAGASLLAGAAGKAEVYISTNGGLNWTTGARNPTGQSTTSVILPPGFSTRGEAFAVTSGTDSAFSRTMDGGVTWQQVSLIDTAVSSIIDAAVSPLHSLDSTLFLVTYDAQHSVQSLWRSVTDGASWERLLSSSDAGVDEIRKVTVSGEYGSGNQVVFLTGTGNGSPIVWKSTDSGTTFTPFPAPLTVDAWATMDANLWIAGYDGSGGRVYRLDVTGFLPPSGATAGSQPLTSLAASPAYEKDRTLLAGNTTGQVYWSRDGGTSFVPLGQQLPIINGIGEVSVAFDPTFNSNGAVYATSRAVASAGDNERIFRFVVGTDDSWQAINSTLPDDTIIGQVAIATIHLPYTTGTLYTIDSQPVDTVENKGGMERSLNPMFPLNQTFETVTRGLDDGAKLDGLWTCGNRLWSVDNHNTRLMTYIDTMCIPVSPASPDDKSPGLDRDNVTLVWTRVPGATQYQWQIDYDGNFSSVPEDFEGSTSATYVRLPTLQPGTTYYWRVRASKPVLSPWSARLSFTTILGPTVSTLELLSPQAGAREVPQKPVFQWNTIAGAEDYELLVSTDNLFTDLAIRKDGDNALPVTAWQSDTTLDNDTTYYWKVRGCSQSSYSAWSAVSAFTTEAAPAAPPPPTPEPEQPSSDPMYLESPPAIDTEIEPEQPDPPLTVEPEPEQPESPPTVEPDPEPMAPQLPPILQTTVEIVVPAWAIYAIVGLLAVMVLLLTVLLSLIVKIRRF
jgi:hypothetical protein